MPPPRNPATLPSSSLKPPWSGNCWPRAGLPTPAAARDEHLEATVILSAVVDTAGSVRRVDVVAGPPAFINSAIAAATWRRYRPFLLHGRPVEVQTRITLRYAPANP